ncbi:MAG: metallophosphoesterase [Bacteroidales bacterium]
MFRTILALSYLIPNIYLFLRLWQFYIPKKYRVWYSVIYAILFIIYPLTRFAGRNTPAALMQILETTSNYLLPFFLYLFLFVLLADILLLINSIVRIVPAELTRERSLRFSILLVIISLSVVVVTAGIINFNTIRTSEYRIEVPGKSSGATGVRIAFVSDFHIEESTPKWFVEKFVNRIRDLEPDLMLFGGDIIESYEGDENMEPFERLIGSIKTTYGVYGVLGNHEHYSPQGKRSFFSRAGIEILADSVVMIDSSFFLAGRHDSHTRTRKSIEELMSTIPDSLPVILMDHRPTEIDLISRTSADVVFSGHTHHGQMFPINLITNRIYELSHGYMKKGETHFFVSSGIRLWGPPVRTTAKSEIMVVDITFTRAD